MNEEGVSGKPWPRLTKPRGARLPGSASGGTGLGTTLPRGPEETEPHSPSHLSALASRPNLRNRLCLCLSLPRRWWSWKRWWQSQYLPCGTPSFQPDRKKEKREESEAEVQAAGRQAQSGVRGAELGGRDGGGPRLSALFQIRLFPQPSPLRMRIVHWRLPPKNALRGKWTF